MTWWGIVLLCYFFHILGYIEATVAERDRHTTWLANSWELLGRRMWWINVVSGTKAEDATVQDIVALNQNLLRTINDFNTVFGREYLKEELLPAEEIVGDEEPNEFNQ